MDRKSDGTVRQRLEAPRVRLPIVRFCLVFLGLVIAAQLVMSTDAVWSVFRRPYCSGLARICALVSRPFVPEIAVHDLSVVTPRFTLRVVRGCDALDAMTFLALGIAAFPATWRMKFAGLAAGLPVIFILNIGRLVLVLFLGLYLPGLLEIVHVYVFQVFIIAVACGCFCWWTTLAAPSPDASRASGSSVRR